MQDIFFKRKDGTNYLSKEELYKTLDVYDSDTFLIHMKELDIPWIPQYWERMIARSIECGHRIESTFGKYYSYMWLKSFRGFTYKDSDFIQSNL